MDFREFIDQSLQACKEKDDKKSSHKEILQGYTIANQPIPQIDKAYITFKSDDGSCFSLNKPLLSRHILLLGGIGVGKTDYSTLVDHSFRLG